jgi:hypothetical protein
MICVDIEVLAVTLKASLEDIVAKRAGQALVLDISISELC